MPAAAQPKSDPSCRTIQLTFERIKGAKLDQLVEVMKQSSCLDDGMPPIQHPVHQQMFSYGVRGDDQRLKRDMEAISEIMEMRLTVERANDVYWVVGQ
jgi:hypothetical protein